MIDLLDFDRDDDQLPSMPSQLLRLIWSDVLQHERLFDPQILDVISKYQEKLLKVIDKNGETGLWMEIVQELAMTKAETDQIAIFKRIQQHSKAFNDMIHCQVLACFIENNLDLSDEEYDD